MSTPLIGRSQRSMALLTKTATWISTKCKKSMRILGLIKSQKFGSLQRRLLAKRLQLTSGLKLRDREQHRSISSQNSIPIQCHSQRVPYQAAMSLCKGKLQQLRLRGFITCQVRKPKWLRGIPVMAKNCCAARHMLL